MKLVIKVGEDTARVETENGKKVANISRDDDPCEAVIEVLTKLGYEVEEQ